MSCNKTTQFAKGAYVFKKCPCTACKIKRQESADFWKRFDLIYKAFKQVN